MNPVNLWQWDGRVNRTTYLLTGAIAFVTKIALDYLVLTHLFYRHWSMLLYWRPFGVLQEFPLFGVENYNYAAVMLTLSLPFLWLGLSMTVKRLRDAGLPVWLVCLFFVPFLNLIFFGVLSAWPSAQELPSEEAAPWPAVRPLDRWIPRTKWGSAILATGLTTLLGLLFALIGTQVVKSYGWGLFVALPFCLGLFSVLLHSYHEPRSFSDCVAVSVLPVVVLGVLLMAIAIEGLICILMAAPIAFALALLGGWLGFAIQALHWGRRHTPAMLSVVILLTPSFFSVEHLVEPQAGIFEVKSSIEINAPPEKVWQQVVSFAEIAPPQEMLFRAGIAYPIRAEISGHGAGAVRHCVFSTGPFVEPITVWDEPRLLRFSVTANPAPLQELSPYGHIEPAHLHGYFESHQGQFLLTPLPGGRTRLEGTTWYSHTMWPEQYWHLWSGYIIHNIHLRVLRHIKAQVEAAH
ncbi:MAG TPA: DUF805 domain-containing protein [Candidatus Dormibacteraeota bacterium]|jgi:uncharacterized membrane protein YhaH (DUF805 family)|nr:DUF805 domain-containing protein [Candidatus Dormibacteraeota bacterium]